MSKRTKDMQDAVEIVAHGAREQAEEGGKLSPQWVLAWLGEFAPVADADPAPPLAEWLSNISDRVLELERERAERLEAPPVINNVVDVTVGNDWPDGLEDVIRMLAVFALGFLLAWLIWGSW